MAAGGSEFSSSIPLLKAQSAQSPVRPGGDGNIVSTQGKTSPELNRIVSPQLIRYQETEQTNDTHAESPQFYHRQRANRASLIKSLWRQRHHSHRSHRSGRPHDAWP